MKFSLMAIVNQFRRKQTLEQTLDCANEKGKKLGIKSEQQVYDIIAGK
jgi:hypothetical protein